MNLQQQLFKSVPNSPLVLFRIIWGALMFAEGVGVMLTGWLDEVYVQPEFLFTFIGFDFLQVFIGKWMYGYFGVMSVLAGFVCVGYRYRISSILYALLWTASYLSHKSHYNNHHYLILLISWVMIFVPAEKDMSFDAKRVGRSSEMPNWVMIVFIAQLLFVYSYGSIAKMYSDWFSGKALEAIFSYRIEHPLLKQLIAVKGAHYFFSYSGIIFDLIVIPFLIWKRTRFMMFIASLFFHLINAVVFKIGVFPFLALGLDIFFLNALFIDKYVFRKKEHIQIKTVYPVNKPMMYLVIVYLIVQMALPLRHWLIPGDVLCTEEGHRMAWRMMLRVKSGSLTYILKNSEGRIIKNINPWDHFTRFQIGGVRTKPDMVWAGAQYLHKKYTEELGIDSLQIYAKGFVNINKNREKYELIDSEVDLSRVKWNTFSHNDWIICSCQNCEQ